MAKSITHILPQDRTLEWAWQAAIVASASLFVALCAKITLPLPSTPVPLTLQNFGVLLVGLMLGSRRGFAALTLYLLEGAVGLPVFNPAGPGGIAQLLGPTGGYLLVYPLVAFLAGWILERGAKSWPRALSAAFFADALLFVGGISWLLLATGSLTAALRIGFYWFVFAEVIKIMCAAALASGWQRTRKFQA